MNIYNSNIEIASEIMTEAAKWLVKINQPLWNFEQLLPEYLIRDYSKENIYVGWEGSEAIAAMALLWHDPVFWPEYNLNESGFIHKLSVRREFANKGYSKEMIIFAEKECLNKNINYLRLDCAGERPRLCNFYKDLGFIQVDRKKIIGFDVARFEKCLL